ncbi:MAG: restriction endonuclease subunit S, partial [bacterium]
MGIYKLEHLLDDVIDYRGKTPKKLNGKWAKEGYRTISAMNVKNGMLVKKKSIRYVNEDIYIKWMKKEVEKNDILLTSEAPLGEVMFWDSNEKIVLGQRLFCLKVNEDLVYPKFLYALMQTELFYKKLIQKQSGTTVFGIRQPQLLKIRINLPEMKKQIDIGDKYYNLELKNK